MTDCRGNCGGQAPGLAPDAVIVNIPGSDEHYLYCRECCPLCTANATKRKD